MATNPVHHAVNGSHNENDLSRNDGEESAYQYCGGNPVAGVDPTGYRTVIDGSNRYTHLPWVERSVSYWMAGNRNSRPAELLRAMGSALSAVKEGVRPLTAWKDGAGR
ncbi:MAG: hypothetical protein KKA32_12915 [Actinobacteria bacterium]|nr:hypothetical protein [Actinomycetota bacterium]